MFLFWYVPTVQRVPTTGWHAAARADICQRGGAGNGGSGEGGAGTKPLDDGVLFVLLLLGEKESFCGLAGVVVLACVCLSPLLSLFGGYLGSFLGSSNRVSPVIFAIKSYLCP